MEILPRPLLRLAQEGLRVQPFKSAGRLAYRVAAEFASRRLERLPGVRTVLLTGSATRIETLEPGYSDIDFLLLTDLEGVEEEVCFRRELGRELRALSLLAPIKSIDYLEAADLGRFRAHGPDWSLALDRRWQEMRGAALAGAAVARDPSHIRLLRLAGISRRWAKGAASALATGSRASGYARRRTSRVLLERALSGWLDEESGTPWSGLMAKARATGRSLPELEESDGLRSRGARAPHEAAIRAHLAACLSILSAWAVEEGASWSGAMRSADACPSVADRHAARLLAERALRSPAFVSAQAIDGASASRPTLLVLVTAAEASAAMAVEALGEVMRDPSAGRAGIHPVVMTPALHRMAALFDPPPLLAAFLSDPSALLAGAAPPAPAAPPVELSKVLIRQRLVNYLYQPAGRAFRVDSSADGAGRALAVDLVVIEALLRSLRDDAVASPAAPAALADETSRVAALRDARDAIRRALPLDGER